MKKTIIITPRQVGKTRLAKYEFLKDPENNILIVCNESEKKRTGIKSNNIISTNKIKTGGLVSKRGSVLILDEYFFFDDEVKALIYQYVSETKCDVIIFSTPKKTYSKFLIELVKKYKRTNSPEDIFFIVLKHYSDESIFTNEELITLKSDIVELYNDFLTDEDTYIVDNEELFKHKILKKYEYPNSEAEVKHIFGSYYETEVEGKWYS